LLNARELFTEEQMNKMGQNSNVAEAAITYTPAFKLEGFIANSRLLSRVANGIFTQRKVDSKERAVF